MPYPMSSIKCISKFLCKMMKHIEQREQFNPCTNIIEKLFSDIVWVSFEHVYNDSLLKRKKMCISAEWKKVAKIRVASSTTLKEAHVPWLLLRMTSRIYFLLMCMRSSNWHLNVLNMNDKSSSWSRVHYCWI